MFHVGLSLSTGEAGSDSKVASDQQNKVQYCFTAFGHLLSLHALRSIGTLFLWKYDIPVHFYHLRKNSRLSFLLNLLRVTLYHIFFC